MKEIALALCVALLLSGCNPQHTPRAGSALVDEQFAKHIGVLAYLYGYPMVDMFRRMHNETHRVSRDQAVYAPLNTLVQADNSSWIGWLDSGSGPVRVRLAAPAGVRFELVSMSLYGERVRSSLVVDASGAAEILLYSGYGGVPGTALSHNTGTAMARLELAADRALGRESVSVHGAPAVSGELRVPALDPMQSLGFFEVLNRLLKQLPARPGDALLLEQFDSIGVGPRSNFSLADLSPASKRGLERAIRDARTLLAAASASRGPGAGNPRDVLARAAAYAVIVEGEVISEKPTAADSR